MALLVVKGAGISCDQGSASTKFACIRPTITAEGADAANIFDFQPMTNIPTFTMCKSATNPAVQAIIASSQGATKEAPCTPTVMMPWSSGASKVKITNIAALTDGCKATCLLGGQITFDDAGQELVEVT
ncbi:MAG: DUF4280 domain-containing protein [Alphaproteobacteria bacterium]|nr:DUF4280 domain-containing protein [Alphaproteobacteria bacterium]